jgi:CRP-like cAMP-binding protein
MERASNARRRGELSGTMTDADKTEIESRLSRKLDRIFEISREEKEALAGAFTEVRDYKAGEDIIRIGERPWVSKLLLDGMVCRYRALGQRRRQVLAFQYPGDIFDAYSFVLEIMDHNIGALMPSRIAFIRHEAMVDVFDRHPRVARAVWKDTLIDAAVFAEWMTNIRAKDPPSQIAHLLCEVFTRLSVVGLREDNAIKWPITHKDLSDALSLGEDYIAVVLENFRFKGWVSIFEGKLLMHNFEALKELAQFDPTYLHLERPRGAAGRPVDLTWVKPL